MTSIADFVVENRSKVTGIKPMIFCMWSMCYTTSTQQILIDFNQYYGPMEYLAVQPLYFWFSDTVEG